MLLGKEAAEGEVYQKVVPASSARPIFLAIYSHGDSHPTKLEPKKGVAVAGVVAEKEVGTGAVAAASNAATASSSAAAAGTAAGLNRNSSFQEVDWRKHEW